MNFFLNRTGRTLGQTNQWTKGPSALAYAAAFNSASSGSQSEQGGGGGQSRGSGSQQQSAPAEKESIKGYGYVPPEQRAAERMVRQQEASQMDAGGLSPNYGELFKRRKRPVEQAV